MKKCCLLLIALAAFAFTAMAQDASQTSSSSGQTSTSKSKSGDHSGMAMDHQASNKASGKDRTLTGCLSSSANSDGMYTLSNAKMKKGVEVGPADKVKDHAGHQVSLTGKWSTAAEAGEANAASTKEKGERHFEVENVKHLSDTCSEAPGGGTMGSKGGKHKSKSSGETSSAPKGR
jgi:hypothetical protein